MTDTDIKPPAKEITPATNGDGAGESEENIESLNLLDEALKEAPEYSEPTDAPGETGGDGPGDTPPGTEPLQDGPTASWKVDRVMFFLMFFDRQTSKLGSVISGQPKDRYNTDIDELKQMAEYGGDYLYRMIGKLSPATVFWIMFITAMGYKSWLVIKDVRAKQKVNREAKEEHETGTPPAVEAEVKSERPASPTEQATATKPKLVLVQGVVSVCHDAPVLLIAKNKHQCIVCHNWCKTKPAQERIKRDSE